MELVELMEHIRKENVVPDGGTGAIYRSPVPSPSAKPNRNGADCSIKPASRGRDSESSERFTLTLQALSVPDGVPPIIRLRRVLKYALRVCGLKCREIKGESASAMAVESTPAAILKTKRLTRKGAIR